MNSLIILMSGILLIAVIQFLCCFCRHVPVKLIPLVLLAVLSVWCFSFRIGREDELPLCSMANLLMLMLFLVLIARVALGWIVYTVIWLWSGDKGK